MNAVGAVAGAGISAIFGILGVAFFSMVFFGMVFFGMASFGVASFGVGFFDEAARVGGIIDGNENDAGALAGNETAESDALTGIGN